MHYTFIMKILGGIVANIVPQVQHSTSKDKFKKALKHGCLYLHQIYYAWNKNGFMNHFHCFPQEC